MPCKQVCLLVSRALYMFWGFVAGGKFEKNKVSISVGVSVNSQKQLTCHQMHLKALQMLLQCHLEQWVISQVKGMWKGEELLLQ